MDSQIDLEKMAIKQAVHYMLQSEIADNVYYETHHNEEQLVKHLDLVEEKIIDYVYNLTHPLTNLLK